ncbi:ferulic acid esterase (FaeA), putative [Metarhizium acridum CQMa 102]|uniref:feruloyl esterase n=1 Tax=Metarhizium acridum (strain CQMa 102) TaxID=655827 RepID=E9EHL3_METAQ|nr:ferulic acid esterase (FaeA), putative [Metarhizium acridum CQMa 102]EFY84612.1 ferulic acid esterase (FaeA), putative [Metarhizium acridum CQMa 102]
MLGLKTYWLQNECHAIVSEKDIGNFGATELAIQPRKNGSVPKLPKPLALDNATPVKLHVQRRLRSCGFYLVCLQLRLSPSPPRKYKVLGRQNISTHALPKTMLLTFAFLFTLIEASAMPSEVSPALPAGCYKPLPQGQFAGGVSTIHVTSDGERRTFLLSIPPEYHSDTPAAAVLSYHGGGRNAEDQLKLDQLTNPEFNSAAFVIYPQGIDVRRCISFHPAASIRYEKNADKHKETWQGVPGATSDDILFTSDILDYVQYRYCIDPTRISATGKSDGGGFCNLLACDPRLSSRVAAFAPVSGAFYIHSRPCRPQTVEFSCRSSRADVPFLEFHGGKDKVISYKGGSRKKECLPSIPHFIQQWASLDGLGIDNTTTRVSQNTVLYTFGHGSKAGLVEHVYDSAIGHDWPSTVPNIDNQNPGHHVASFNATPMILDFFAKHPLSLGLGQPPERRVQTRKTLMSSGAEDEKLYHQRVLRE